MTSYPSTLSPIGTRSIAKYEKRDSLDEKYTKRRRQTWVARVKQQELQQKQLLIFGTIITALFLLVFLFFWGNPISTTTSNAQHHPPPPFYNSNYQRNHRKHLREQSGDELGSNDYAMDNRKKMHVKDDDDIGIKSKPADKEILDLKMAQAIEDLKKFQKKVESGNEEKDTLSEEFTAPSPMISPAATELSSMRRQWRRFKDSSGVLLEVAPLRSSTIEAIRRIVFSCHRCEIVQYVYKEGRKKKRC
eukprot:scaffold2277_cov137-Cylindrotheca_fusiformis.AAC.3